MNNTNREIDATCFVYGYIHPLGQPRGARVGAWMPTKSADEARSKYRLDWSAVNIVGVTQNRAKAREWTR